MTTAQGCRERQIPPQLEKGEIRDEGVYLRNLKGSQVSKRYELDSDDPPIYGYRIKAKFWNDHSGDSSISVNELACVGSDCCSIAIHPTSSIFRHVARIDLSELNQRYSVKFVAVYDPVQASESNGPEHADEPEPESTNLGPPNPCHFLLLPREGSTSSFFALKTILDAQFPEGRLPNANERKSTLSLVQNYAAAIQIVRDVWPPPQQHRSPDTIENLGGDSSDQPIQQ